MPNRELPNSESIYRLKITLEYIDPPIWREVLIPGWFSLCSLHGAIQDAMGWERCHLHDFRIAGKRYAGDDLVDGVLDESKFTLSDLARRQSKSTYTYDFGDDWRHTIAVEDIVPPEPGAKYPWCIGGARNGPPEDSGGPGGYERMLEEDGEFDPEAFSADAVNKRMHPEPEKRKPRKRIT